MCVVTDGRCVLAEVSRVLGRCDRWPMCLGQSFPCGDRWPMCVGPCLVTDGRCVLAEVSRVCGGRVPFRGCVRA